MSEEKETKPINEGNTGKKEWMQKKEAIWMNEWMKREKQNEWKNVR